MNDFFSFQPPGFRFMRAYRFGSWDGYVRLYSTRSKILYRGLISYLEAFCIEREYDLLDEASEKEEPVSLLEVEDFLKTLNLPAKYETRDYQVESIAHCIRRSRAVLVSPTGSGKSFIIYALIRWFEKRTLLVVPSLGLVHQMFDDFKEYSSRNVWNADQQVSKIMGGYSKDLLKPVTISTWQSIYEMPKDWFDQFEMVIVDEVHGAKAKSLVSILESLNQCDKRFGFTGTLDDVKVHRLVIEGLLGKAHKIVDTKTLIDQKKLSAIDIRCLLLSYSKETRKTLPRDYVEEIQFITSHEKRNKFITNLALSLKDNTLVLFRYVESHGQILYDMIKAKAPPETEVYFIFGGTDSEMRNEIRKVMDTSNKKVIIVASVGVFQQGINIVNLHNIIAASPSKSLIQILQAIGRGLRRGDTKESFTWYDIADDLSKTKANKNYTLLHFAERLKIYTREQFPFKIRTIELEG